MRTRATKLRRRESTDPMKDRSEHVRVLYSFPHKLGADRICYTAWQQVNGLANAGAEVTACPGVLHRPVPGNVDVRPTLARGRFRIPYKLFGKLRVLALHDRIVARRLPKLVDKIDVVHTWPAAALETLKAAAKLGIPTVIERPNAHTRFAFEAVGKEFDRLGLTLPSTDEYFFNAELLQREEEEYERADYVLCPSDFVVKTFVDQGVPREKLVRHGYGFDDRTFYPEVRQDDPTRGLTMIFVGVCAVRKGVHFALEAWLQSPASQNGTFLIAGEFLPSYADKLSAMLSHPSVKVLGHRNDVPALMRQSDILVLPSVEEGYGLVVAEAIGSGCIPLASDACTEICGEVDKGLVHRVGDVAALAAQISKLNSDRELLRRLRAAMLQKRNSYTWSAAGERLQQAYRTVISDYSERHKHSSCAHQAQASAACVTN